MIAYLGSGPYCYSNCLAMMLGPHAPSPSVIEVLTGSPFGVELIAGEQPQFNPYGWDPDLGLDAAIDLLGWACQRAGASDAAEALAALLAVVERGPALVGPVEMGLLLHQPCSGTPIQADHFVVVFAVEGDLIRFHDPHGYPYASLPTAAFLAAWRAETIGYAATRYPMRHGFTRTRQVTDLEALRSSLPAAVNWLTDRHDPARPGDCLGGAAAVERLADMVGADLPAHIQGLLTAFGIRVGTRRLGDAATALTRLGMPAAATIATRQASLLGSLQYDLVAGSTSTAASTLRHLASGYQRLREAMT